MSPSAAMENEAFDPAVRIMFNSDNKGAGEQMAFRKPAADFQLFPHDNGSFGPDDFQLADSAGRASFQRNDMLQIAKIKAGFFAENGLQFIPCIGLLPAVEMRCFPVKGRQDPAQQFCIRCVAICGRPGGQPVCRVLLRLNRRMFAVTVGNALEIGRRPVFPCGWKNLRLSSTAFIIACIANFAVVNKK